MPGSSVPSARVSDAGTTDAPIAGMVELTSDQAPVQGFVDMEPELQNELEVTQTSEIK